MTLWEPFPAPRRRQLVALLSTPPRGLDDLTRVRAQMSGRLVALTALEALCAAEVGFAGRLFGRIVPSIFEHARTLLESEDEPALDIHKPGRPQRTVMNRRDVAGWVAHIALGTLPDLGMIHPDIDLAPLLQGELPQQRAKLRCMLAYFDKINEAAPRGRFVVERLHLPARTPFEWAMESSPLTALTVDARGSIEDAALHLQVDFANEYLGGGVLRKGCVQEEIRFSVAPELLAAMILSPRMTPDEAIVMRGAERFAATRGYAQKFEYAGPFNDPSPHLADGSVDVDFVAIDAIDYRRGDPKAQYRDDAMLRELDKARVGFKRDARNLAVATGNWGCGAFLGDPALKAVLQWMAASSEGRALRYCTYGDARVGDLARFATLAPTRFATVGALWTKLRTAVADGGPDLYERLLA
jgi:Poly (ADP-ribose) glycohydrolase (PARG)